MKTIYTIVVLFLFFFTTESRSQFVSSAIFNSLGPGQNVSFTSPCNGSSQSVFAGLLNCTVDGNASQFYCIDLCRTINYGDTIRDSAISIPKIVYILNNYYPYKTSYPSKLPDNNEEASSIACAIWNLKQGLIVSSITNTTIRDRAAAILLDANTNGGSTVAVKTIQILPDVDPDAFYIKTLDQNGNPIAVNNIQLAITQGTLNTYNVNTDASGVSPAVYVSGTNSGTITAKGVGVIPQGMAYASLAHTLQALIMAKPTFGNIDAETDWGALPVELSAFTAKILGRNVELNWTTATELNNSGFNIERKTVGGNEWTTIGNVAGNGSANHPNDYSFLDRNVTSGSYDYRLKQIDYNGNYEYFSLTSEVTVGAPTKFELLQNYPNPFNPTTKIDFDLPESGVVTLKVYNSSGKEIATLVNGFRPSGFHSVTFDASGIATGVYYYKIEANGISKVMKMMLVK